MENKRKQNILIKLCCVFISFILWIYIYNYVNPIKTIRLRVPVNILNADTLSQSKLILLPDQQFYVNLSVKGNASDVSMITHNQFKLTADLSGYAFKKGDTRVLVQVSKAPNGVVITNSDALWIQVKVDELIEKTLPIKPVIKGEVSKNHYAFTPSLKPTNVVISGPSQYINSVDKVVANIDLTDVSKDMSLVAALKAVDSGGRVINEINVEPSSTEVIVPVKKIKTVGINVVTKGKISKNVVLKSITPVVDKVDIAVDDENKSIEQINTEPVDLSSVTSSKTMETNLVLPDGVKLINGKELIDVKITVSNIIQKNFNEAIKTNNLGSGLNAVLSTQSATIILSGEDSSVNAVKDSDIDCSVDLKSLGEGSFEVPVNVTVPNGVSSTSVSPQTVKVTITKKQ